MGQALGHVMMATILLLLSRVMVRDGSRVPDCGRWMEWITAWSLFKVRGSLVEVAPGSGDSLELGKVHWTISNLGLSVFLEFSLK